MSGSDPRIVIIAVDNSEQADHAFDWYAKGIHKADNELVLVHVPELADHDRNRMQYLTTASWQEALEKEKKKKADLEKKYNDKLKEKALAGRIISEGGKPGEVIVKIASQEKAAMIVMGTRGQGKVRRTIMGSVSDFVVHHAHCPVIVCRQ